MWCQFAHAHEGSVNALRFSPRAATQSQDLLYSAGGDDEIAIWDYHAAVCVMRLRGGHGRDTAINDLVFTPDCDSGSSLLMSAGDDASVVLWDLRRGARPLARLNGFGEGVNKVLCLSPSSMPESSCAAQKLAQLAGCSSMSGPRFLTLSAADNGEIYLHAVFPPALGDIASEEFNNLSEHEAQEEQRSGRRCLATAGVLLEHFTAALGPVNDLAVLSSDRTRTVVLAASEDGALRSWELFPTSPDATERLVESLDVFSNPVNHVVCVPEGWAGIAEDNAAEVCHVLAASSECVFGLVFSGTTVVQAPESVQTLVGHRDYVRGIELVHPGAVLTVADDGTAIEWGWPTGELKRRIRLHEGMVLACATAPAADAFASGTESGELRVWRLPFRTERVPRGELQGEERPV